MIPKKRQQEIYKYIVLHKTVTLGEISKKFKVSIYTIRRDLDFLCRANLIEKVYGGASIKGTGNEDVISKRMREHVDEKSRIAKEALKRISNGNNIFIESGSTCLALVNILGEIERINIITISPHITKAVINLKRNNLINGTLYCTGGIWMGDPDDIYYGTHATNYFNDINIDIAFLGIVALDAKYGWMVPTIGEADIIKKLLPVSNKIIGLTDSTKFDKKSLNKIGPVSIFDEIITDNNISEKIAKRYSSETKITLV